MDTISVTDRGFNNVVIVTLKSGTITTQFSMNIRKKHPHDAQPLWVTELRRAVKKFPAELQEKIMIDAYEWLREMF